MENVNYSELVVFILYLIAMVGIGVYFFLRHKNAGEKHYFLGNRQMGPWVAALSAGASDMSAWVLMGLPTSIYAAGLGKLWIAVGLAIGYALSWIFEAPRLRVFSIVSDDSITIPQYLSNRFKTKSHALQILCAVVFLLAYTVYAASSVKACGNLFHKVLGINTETAMYISALVIVSYTFLGGFSAVCWTDFFQGLLVLGAVFLVPIFANFIPHVADAQLPANYWSCTSDWKDIVSGLSWGLGYFGMPHIIIRFMSLKSQSDLKMSAKIGITWTVLILLFAVLIGLIGRLCLGIGDPSIKANEIVFVQMVRAIFPAVISGVLLSAILAAAMSTADSQLLAASSAFSSDVYKPVVRKNKASDKEILWAGRLIVLLVAIVALFLAKSPNSGSIMNLVENAWGLFGAAFGPAILLSLFWRRFNFAGALAGIASGAVIDICWLTVPCLKSIGIYEILPGFVGGAVIAILVTLATAKPNKELEDLYDEAVKQLKQ